MSAKERKRKSAKERKGGANVRKRALLRKKCKQPGLKQPGLGTAKEMVFKYHSQELRTCLLENQRVLGKHGRDMGLCGKSC